MAQDQGLAELIAGSIKGVRMAFGWSQRELADRLGSNQSAVARMENPASSHLDLDLASRAIELLGIRPTFDTNLPGLNDRRAQRDRVDARCCGYLGRRLGGVGWEVQHEVEVGSGRGRGWIDVLAYRQADRALFCAEVKTELHDIGAVLRSLAWYERGAWAAARRHGWAPTRMTSGVVMLATDANDEAITTNRELLQQAFPGRTVELIAWLRDPAQGLPPRTIGLADPRSRRSNFLRPTRLEGRRSPSPYRGYAHAAAVLGERR